jgi:uncharacterized protein (TIGR02118 family)
VIKLMSFIRRPAGMSQEDFFAHWSNVHRPLIERHAETLGIKGYVQTHAREAETTRAFNAVYDADGQEPYDGVAELWLEDPGVLTDPPSDEARSALGEIAADEPNFVDGARSYQFLGEDFRIIG